jgi:hypothetical protein
VWPWGQKIKSLRKKELVGVEIMRSNNTFALAKGLAWEGNKTSLFYYT